MKPSVFVIVPAYNEGRVIASTLKPVIEAGYSVVVIDDGSQDDSWRAISALPVHALRHPINLGQGASLQTGTDYALRQGADLVVHFDADGQHQVSDIQTLTETLVRGDADVALGSRFLDRESIQKVPNLKRIILRGGVVVNGLVTGVWLTDAHNGLRALTREAAQKIRIRENRYAHASEILMLIRRHRLRVVERSVHIVYTEYSQAKGQSAWNALNILIDIVLRKLFQ